MDRQAYIKGLYDLASWLNDNPAVPLPEDTLNCYSCDTKEEAATVARAMRSFEKEFNDWHMSLKKDFGPLRVRYVFTRSNVCTRKVVGVETIPAKFVPAVEAHTEPARTREIVEWECGSVLAVEQEQQKETKQKIGRPTTLGSKNPEEFF